MRTYKNIHFIVSAARAQGKGKLSSCISEGNAFHGLVFVSILSSLLRSPSEYTRVQTLKMYNRVVFKNP